MDSLCRVCIEEATNCTLLNTKIENSLSISFFDFLNKCTNINGRDGDNLPQSLCSNCTNSIKTFHSFVKLVEKSNIILKEALKSYIVTGRCNDNRDTSCEETIIAIETDVSKEEPGNLNKEESYCRTTKNFNGSSLSIVDLVKEEPCILIPDFKAGEINESNTLNSNPKYPKERIEDAEDILTYIDRRLASIDAISIGSQDVNDSQSNILSKANHIPDTKKKISKRKAKTKVIKERDSNPQRMRHSRGPIDNKESSCEGITIRSKKIREDSEIFNKEKSLHCHTSKNLTESSLAFVDFVKEEPRLSKSTTIVDLKYAAINESDQFHSNPDHSKISINNIFSRIDVFLASIDTEHNDPEEDVPISLLKSNLFKNKDETNSQKTKIEVSNQIKIGHKSRSQVSSEAKGPPLKPHIREHTYKCVECDIVFNGRQEFMAHCRNHVYDKHECHICKKNFARRRYLYNHLLIHETKKKYKCSICGIRFKYISNKCRHMKLHSNEKPFECEICGKKFHTKADKNSHLRVHSIINHKCPQCGKSYRTKRSLLIHINEHADKPLAMYKCDICGKRYGRKQTLTFHMRSHEIIKNKTQCDKELT